jgi:hypothetical protein
MRTVLPSPKYADPIKRLAFFERAVARHHGAAGRGARGVRVQPAVHDAGQHDVLQHRRRRHAPDRDHDAMFRSGTPDYLAMLDAKLTRGV